MSKKQRHKEKGKGIEIERNKTRKTMTEKEEKVTWKGQELHKERRKENLNLRER